jgi:hypothetical protein
MKHKLDLMGQIRESLLSKNECRYHWRRDMHMTRRKKTFSPVKQVKKLSREWLKTRRGKVIQSKKGILLEKVADRESQESIETLEGEH